MRFVFVLLSLLSIIISGIIVLLIYYFSPFQIYAWLEFLAERYKPFVQLVEVGKSYENRTILGVHISFGKKKPIIFIDGGLHSNEW